jgi:hypothetical protein
VNDPRLRWLGGLLLLLLAGWACALLIARPQPAGPLPTPITPELEPHQINIEQPIPIPYHTKQFDVKLWPRASYTINGMVVARDTYRFDAGAALSPLDLSLAWGQVPKYRSLIHFSHGYRFYFFSYGYKGPFDLSYIAQHSANVHMIPATPNVRKALLAVRNHQTVRLTGFLVDITGTVKQRRFTWKTSTTREDTGDGACEVMYVREVDWKGKSYR